ncbi:hypothetical protein BN1723_009974 [Verticillium longisporum]|uniref:Oxidoreductase N-terminal domain-containing protein n=1 Tax=Verticillium longisporum TaxID=100787 RepID=A0A0G4KUB3_VERLO|nr:hypothetical protein BN1723_009974 [Verticillium longisporum]
MSESLRVVLAERPKADIIPGQTFKTEKQPVPREEDLKDGEVLVENLYLSLDPAMRGWLNDKRSYLPPVQIGETMRGAAVSRILASKSDKAAAGDIIPTYAGWAEHAILPPAAIQPAAAYPPISHPTDYLSVLGTTGLTAYFGMLRIGEPKAGETVVVSRMTASHSPHPPITLPAMRGDVTLSRLPASALGRIGNPPVDTQGPAVCLYDTGRIGSDERNLVLRSSDITPPCRLSLRKLTSRPLRLLASPRTLDHPMSRFVLVRRSLRRSAPARVACLTCRRVV